MASGSEHTSFFFFFFFLFLASSSLLRGIRSDDASDQLFQGLNGYRSSRNLTMFVKNDNAECLADQLAEQFKGQPCTNTTGSFTVPGTEQQFPNFLDFLNHCHLNISATRDGAVMPACVPGLDQAIVLTNYTKTQYSQNLNSTDYTGAGIADEGDWIIVVLTTNTPTGNYATASGGSLFLKPSATYRVLPLLCGVLLVFLV